MLRRGQLGQSLQPVDPEAAFTKNVRRLHRSALSQSNAVRKVVPTPCSCVEVNPTMLPTNQVAKAVCNIQRVDFQDGVAVDLVQNNVQRLGLKNKAQHAGH